jgi:hypothetical protein
LISFEPRTVLRPTSIDELKRMLEQVHRDGGRVRVPGSLHSCSQIVVSDTILDTSQLPKQIDVQTETVEATANVTLHDFLEELSKHGRSATATGGVDHQTLAGLISTGTAPASSRNGLWTALDWVELVTVDAGGNATERRIARDDADWPAVVCSLGLIGVLTKVGMRTVEERYFNTVLEAIDLDEVLSDLDATSAKYDFWRVNWVPKSDKALLWAATEVPKDKSKPDGDYPRDQAEHILDTVFKVVDKLTDSGPLLTKPLELVYDVMALTYKPAHHTGPLKNMLPVDRRAPLHVAMAEWSFLPQDIHRVIGECEDYFGKQGWPNIPTEIELTRADGALMSPWNLPGADYVVKFNWMYLTEVCTKPGEKEEIYAHLRGLWDHLTAAGVPFKAHWGKVNFIDPDFVAKNHDFAAFKPLIAPIFMNDYLEERLG